MATGLCSIGYIPDKNLYSAVMFALKMSPDLQMSFDRHIHIAANYYHVDYADVLSIVRKELWTRELNIAKKTKGNWHTIYNHVAPDLLNTGPGNNYIFICPRCGKHYSCNADDYLRIHKIYTSKCSCGFEDEYQQKFIRKDFFDHTHKED